jgi:hypothetical protein
MFSIMVLGLFHLAVSVFTTIVASSLSSSPQTQRSTGKPHLLQIMIYSSYILYLRDGI